MLELLKEVDFQNEFPLVLGMSQSSPPLHFREVAEKAFSICQEEISFEFKQDLLASSLDNAEKLLSKGPDILSKDEIASISLYTMDSPFYEALNTLFCQRKRDGLRDAFSYLHLLFTALHKLAPLSPVSNDPLLTPSEEQKESDKQFLQQQQSSTSNLRISPSDFPSIFRGAKTNLVQEYSDKKEITWWGLGRCSQSLDIFQQEELLPKQEGTIFEIKTGRVVDIGKYSFYPDETDYLLLLPGTQFYVKGEKKLPSGQHLMILEENFDVASLLPEYSLKKSDLDFSTFEPVMDDGKETSDVSFDVEFQGTLGFPPPENSSFLGFPRGLTVSFDEQIFVTDAQKKAIYWWSADGKFKRSFEDPNLFERPVDVAIDKKDRIVILDFLKCGVVIIEPEELQMCLMFGKRGTGSGELQFPCGVTIDNTNNNIIVADTYNHRIQTFLPSGDPLRSFGCYGSGNGEFAFPNSLAVDQESGLLVVSNCGNYRVDVMTTRGLFIRTFGSYGIGPSCFRFPVGVAVDVLGYVYVVDEIASCIKVFSLEGNFLLSFCSESSRGEEEGSYDGEDDDEVSLVLYPHGVAVNNSGFVFVSDWGKEQVLVWQIYQKE